MMGMWWDVVGVDVSLQICSAAKARAFTSIASQGPQR